MYIDLTEADVNRASRSLGVAKKKSGGYEFEPDVGPVCSILAPLLVMDNTLSGYNLASDY